MKHLKKITYLLILIFTLFPINATADNHNLGEILELIQKDIKTLERAVYSETEKSNTNDDFNSNSLDKNSEDVLTRHLLKLSEIEKQFQDLTNRFEEINFKLDKLSTRVITRVKRTSRFRINFVQRNGKRY